MQLMKQALYLQDTTAGYSDEFSIQVFGIQMFGIQMINVLSLLCYGFEHPKLKYQNGCEYKAVTGTGYLNNG